MQCENLMAPPAVRINRAPVKAITQGVRIRGGVLLFVDAGRLSALEYWWVTEERPDVMPRQRRGVPGGDRCLRRPWSRTDRFVSVVEDP